MKRIVFSLGLVVGLQGVADAATVNFAAEERKAAAIRPTPPMPTNSPTQIFRRLLAMSAPERAEALAAKTPEARRVIEAKLSEYTPLPPEERELRLRMLDLRVHLIPLLHTPPTHRAARLAAIPLEDRPLVEARLRVWDVLPPALRQEVLDNELALRYIVTLESGTPAQREQFLGGLPLAQREKLEKDIVRWEALPPDQRHRMKLRFEQFFTLNDREKEMALARVAQTQREQLQKTMRAFQDLPKAQRDLCLEGLSKFTQLTPQERMEFLKNCERWQAMTPEEQKAWRASIVRAAPRPPLPPLPKGLAGYPNLLSPLRAGRVATTNQ